MTDVVDLVMRDHRELEQLMDQIRTERATRGQLAKEVMVLLVAHSRAEEAEVYPALAERVDSRSDVEEATHEHEEAETLAQQLVETRPESPDFDTVLARLAEAIEHHVREEEQQLLPRLREAVEPDELDQLAEAFTERRMTEIAAVDEEVGDIVTGGAAAT